MLQAQIQNFSYQKCWRNVLEEFNFENVNDLSSKCLINFGGKTLALSKWVSPKRIRSYPYARVYDTFDNPKTNKVVTIIPIIKDEGLSGDMDYLQWDTISLMSLLNVYVILGFYDYAEVHPTRKNKITKQKFNNNYIVKQLTNLISYHQSALHWNLSQLENKNLSALVEIAKNSYKKIEDSLNVKLHNTQNIDKFAQKISEDRKTFIEFSRQKAQQAQNRESLTIQPKEQIGIGQKAKITISNYLGGQYFFTIDDVLFKNGILYLCESKHTKSSLLPSSDDIKDGLLKLMLYNNLSSITGYKKFKIILRLTSNLLRDSFSLPNNNVDSILAHHDFSNTQISILKALNIESQNNHFEVWINYEQ